jgi:hypothetical protein
MVIRVMAMPDCLTLPDSLKCSARFSTGTDSVLVFASMVRNSAAFTVPRVPKPCGDFQLRPREKFLYACGAIDDWEWEFRVLDQQVGADGDRAPLCIAGRGAAPPEVLPLVLHKVVALKRPYLHYPSKAA